MNHKYCTSDRVDLKPTTKRFMGTSFAMMERSHRFAEENKSYVFTLWKRSGKKGISSVIEMVGFAVPK